MVGRPIVSRRSDKKPEKKSATDKEQGNEREYVWQEGQWCLEGLIRSQKRRVQCLRNRELEQAQTSGRPQVWRAK